MGSCFRPSASKEPIYIALINKIVAEALKPPPVQIQSSPTQRIHKKGDLRKLIEHLSSHRYNVHYSMVYLAKLLDDSGNNQVVLIITNELMKNLSSFTSQEFSDLSQKSNKKKKLKEVTLSKFNAYNTRQIDINFQLMYFPIVMTVFDGEQSLKVRVMESVNMYAQAKKEKFLQDKFVSRMLARLLLLLKSEKLVREAIETYSSLISKSSIYMAQNQNNHEALFIILKYWINNPDDPYIKYYCSSIANVYIFESMQGRQYLELFTVMISLYDKCSFKEGNFLSLEVDLLLTLEEEQVKERFLKGLFRYLLVYLSLSEDSRVRENWEKVIFTIPYMTLRSSHIFILSSECKLNGFDTLQRWIKLQFIDINQLINFNRLSLYSCFKFNIMGQISEILLTKILTTFIDIYQLCNQNSKFLLTQMLIQDIHYGTNITLSQLKSLVWLARKFIVAGLVIQDSECFNFFKPLECIPQQRLKIQEIILMYALLLDSCKMPLNYNIIQSLCDVSYSFYDILDIAESTVRQKYLMVQSILHFMKRLHSKGYSEFVLLWVNGLPKAKKPTSVSRYFDKLLVLQIWQLLTATKRMPDEMIQLNKQIQIQSNSEVMEQIWEYEKSHPQIQVSSRLSPIEKGQVSARYLFIKEKFQKLIRKERMPDPEEEVDKDRGSQEAKRRSSVVESQHSYKTDQSFQEIFGMITLNEVDKREKRRNE